MFHKFKIITLTLVAAFAMSAIAVSAAQAEFPAQLTAEAGTVSIHSEQEFGTNVVLTRGTRTVNCNVRTSTGSATNGAAEVTLTPTYSGCEALGIGPATITTNGCGFRVTFAADEADTFTGIVDLVCTDLFKPKQIEIHVYTSAANHTANKPACTYDFTEAANQGLNSIDFTNEPAVGGTPKDWILAHLNLTNIISNSTIGSVLLCGPVNDNAGTLKGTEKIKGKNVANAITGITVSTK